MEGVEIMQSALSKSDKNSAIAYPDMWKKTNHVFVSVKFHENEFSAAASIWAPSLDALLLIFL